MTRRLALQVMLAAGEFWNRRRSDEWTVDEVQKLLHESPWAKPTNADFELDTDAPALQVAPGGAVKPAERAGRQRQPATVIWESGQPVLDARHAVLGPQFSGRYVLSAGEIPLAAMQRRRRAEDPTETAADRRRRMIEELSVATTLEVKGKGSIQAGLVEASARSPQTYLFGFSRELLQIDRDDREVVFALKTPFITLRAKFEPRKMIYRGMLAV